MPPSAEIATFGYHDVTDDRTTSGFQRAAAWPYKHTWAAFASHLDGIASLAWSPPLVSDLAIRRAGRQVLLTFDDGGKSALTVAEELARRGWSAHFFVVTGRIGQLRFLDPGEIRHVRQCGHLVGSHSHTHPDIFRRQSWEQMLREWTISADILANLLGEPCIAASVPGGDLSRMVVRSAAAAGFAYLFTSEPVLVPERADGCWVLGRLNLKAGISAARVRDLASFRGWGRERLTRRLKGVARTLFPPLYVQYMRYRTREREA